MNIRMLSIGSRISGGFIVVAAMFLIVGAALKELALNLDYDRLMDLVEEYDVCQEK